MKPIIVVGAGPVGLTTALALDFYGLPFVLFEEDAELSRDTKAGTVLTRTLEAFRRYGVADRPLAQALRAGERGATPRATKTSRTGCWRSRGGWAGAAASGGRPSRRGRWRRSRPPVGISRGAGRRRRSGG